MSVFEIVIIAGIVGIGIAIYAFLFRLYCTATDWCDRLMERPAGWLGGLWSSLKNNILSLPIRIGIMVALFVISIVYIGISFFTLGSPQACFQAIIDGTTIGSFIALAEVQFAPDAAIGYSAMVGAALSSFISIVYMRFTVETVKDMSNELLWSKVATYSLCVVFNILFACMACLFAIHLADWYVAAADLLVELYETMAGYFNGSHTSNLWGFLATIGTGLALLLMLIAVLITFIIVVREYLDTIFYSLFAMFILVVIAMISQYWLHLPEIVTAILAILALITPDFLRGCEPVNHIYRRILGCEEP